MVCSPSPRRHRQRPDFGVAAKVAISGGSEIGRRHVLSRPPQELFLHSAAVVNWGGAATVSRAALLELLRRLGDRREPLPLAPP